MNIGKWVQWIKENRPKYSERECRIKLLENERKLMQKTRYQFEDMRSKLHAQEAMLTEYHKNEQQASKGAKGRNKAVRKAKQPRKGG